MVNSEISIENAICCANKIECIKGTKGQSIAIFPLLLFVRIEFQLHLCKLAQRSRPENLKIDRKNWFRFNVALNRLILHRKICMKYGGECTIGGKWRKKKKITARTTWFFCCTDIGVCPLKIFLCYFFFFCYHIHIHRHLRWQWKIVNWTKYAAQCLLWIWEYVHRNLSRFKPCIITDICIAFTLCNCCWLVWLVDSVSDTHDSISMAFPLFVSSVSFFFFFSVFAIDCRYNNWYSCPTKVFQLFSFVNKLKNCE